MAEANNSEATDLAGASGGNISNTRTSTSNSSSGSSSSSRTTANSNGLVVTVVAAKCNGSRPNDSTDCVCSLDIPRRLAYEWHQSRVCCVAAVNESLKAKLLDENNLALQEKLRVKVSYQFGAKFASKKGGVRKRYLDGSILFDVKNNEISASPQLLSQLTELKDAVKRLGNEVASKNDLIQQLQDKVDENTELLRKSSAIVNEGKLYSDVGDRQKRRKANSIKEATEKALWFLDTFGLRIEKMVLRSTTNNERVELNFSSTGTSNNEEEHSQEPSESESTIIQEVLFLLEKFGISDECYHEMTMILPCLPRSYKVKQMRTDISNSIDIKRLPQPAFGAYRPVADYLKALICDEFGDELPSTVRVKLSGDGAKFSKSSSYVLLSLSFPGVSNVLAGTGNHTFAAVKISEKYELLRDSLKPVFKELNSLIKKKKIVIGGTTVALDFVFGSDLKFMLMVLGLNAANAHYSCLWCEIHQQDRWDTSIDAGKYNGDNLRNLSTMKHQASMRPSRRSKVTVDSKKGCINPPLLEIEPANCVVDELHLFLRITDVLLVSFFSKMVALDHAYRVHQTGTDGNVSAATGHINKLGVSFNVWMKKEGGKETSKLEMTTLNRNERLRVLRGLPSSFDKLLPSEVSCRLAKLWLAFADVYDMITQANPTEAVIAQVEIKAREWITDFIGFSGELDGHQKSRVTPYMHIMAYHVPEMMKKYGNVRQFSGQGVEKNNDDAKRHYYSGNRHDAPRDILLTEARMEVLAREEPSVVREKRPYNKRKAEYWEADIFEQRQSKRLQLDDDAV